MNDAANVFAARGVNLVRPWIRSPGIGMAMGILGPLEANAPTDACYRIIGLKAMLGLAMGDGEQARELAEQAIGYDASDRFASSVLDRLPETDPVMEATNVWENGGHLGR